MTTKKAKAKAKATATEQQQNSNKSWLSSLLEDTGDCVVVVGFGDELTAQRDLLEAP
jgi:hypothetical protein